MRTNAIIIWMVMLCMALSVTAQQPPKLPVTTQFIQMTEQVTYEDGAVSPVGMVEAAIDYTPTAFVIWGENGKRYQVKRSQAKKITPEEAAVALFVERQALFNNQEKLNEALAGIINVKQNQNANMNELQQMQAALALIKQIQDLANGGGGGVMPMPGRVAGGNHWIKSVVERGQTIQLEDGSVWQINPLNKVDAILWLATERITIVDSGNAFYPHKLINTSSKSTAEAKLISR